MIRSLQALFAVVVANLCLANFLLSQVIIEDRLPDSSRQKLDEMTSRGIEFLKSTQAPDGSFSKHLGPGLTALAATAMLSNGIEKSDKSVRSALDYLKTQIKASGGIHAEDSLYRSYETCIAILCLTEANQDGEFTETIEAADAYVRSLQWGPETETDPDDPAYGGFGYGTHRRPDLSNTAYAIEALRAAGAKGDDEAIQRAIIFVSRTQNMQSQFNNTEAADKIGDKGFYYTPADTPGLVDSENRFGSSQAGKTETGGLRSYGSMTYAGLKSLLYAGVTKEDIRVQGAVEWIKRNYTLEHNPGMEFAGPKKELDGLFYYYQVFGKALDALGVDKLEDTDGVEHQWRAGLIEKLAELQQADGSWINQSARWMEDNQHLVTSYVLLALAYAREDAEKK